MKIASLNDLTCPFHNNFSFDIIIDDYIQQDTSLNKIRHPKFCLKICMINQKTNNFLNFEIKNCVECFRIEIISGKLICPKCKSEYPIIRGIPSFFTTDYDKGQIKDGALIKKYRETLDTNNLRALYESKTYIQQYLRILHTNSLNFFGERKFQLITEKFLTELRSDMIVLDIGTGGANYAKFIRDEKKSKIWACDISFPLLTSIQKKFHDIFVAHCDIAQLPFRTSLFDYILCLDVLEHVKYPIQSIQYLYSTLKKGGRLIISLPNFYNYDIREAYVKFQTAIIKLLNLLRKCVQKSPLEFHDRHLNKLKIGTWGKILRTSGFRKVKPCGYILVPPLTIPGGIPLHRFEQKLYHSWVMRKIIFPLEDRLYNRFPFYFFGQGILFICEK